MIKESDEMEGYLLHEFAKQPPSLFSKGLMRKNVKSGLAAILKSKVSVHLVQHTSFLIDVISFRS